MSSVLHNFVYTRCLRNSKIFLHLLLPYDQGVTTKEYGALLVDLPSSHGGRYADYYVPTFSGKSTGRVLSPDLNRYQPRYEVDRVHVTGGVCNMDKRAAMLICGNQGYPNGGKVIYLHVLIFVYLFC